MMNAVIEHNRLDIVSLFFLAKLITEAYPTTGSSLGYSEDLHSLLKWYDRRREREKIEIVYNQAEKLSENMSSDAILFLCPKF